MTTFKMPATLDARLIADITEDKNTGRLRCDWLVLRAAEFTSAHVAVCDKRNR